ncbi:MAG: hypothetical protein AMS22_06355 [Thiotrichales bacterium SG8_50]|nr:MAG: hypothetical protein AMS22_06355 [Thiotrichales bacterium SG8_50]
MLHLEACRLIEHLSLPAMRGWLNAPHDDANPFFAAVMLLVGTGFEVYPTEVRRALLRHAYNSHMLYTFQYDEIEAKL